LYRLGPLAVVAPLPYRCLAVVGRPAKGVLSVLPQGPGRAGIAVERRTDTGGIQEQRSARARSAELLLAVSEQARPVRLAGEQPLLARLGFRSEALDVG